MMGPRTLSGVGAYVNMSIQGGSLRNMTAEVGWEGVGGLRATWVQGGKGTG